ncbi:MAG: GtrA family protein [Patescibacteria group bacterium]
MKKKDLVVVFILSEIIAVFLSFILTVNKFDLFPAWFLFIIVPILAIIANFIASFVGKKIPIIFQLARYFTVGIANTVVDIGILSLLMLISGIAEGNAYSVFKGISFIIAVVHSYLWNRSWTFGATRTKKTKQEFSQFFIISIIVFIINVSIASLIVNMIGPQFGVSKELWATIGACIGSVVSLVCNFMGYKLIVFKEKNGEQPSNLS